MKKEKVSALIEGFLKQNAELESSFTLAISYKNRNKKVEKIKLKISKLNQNSEPTPSDVFTPHHIEMMPFAKRWEWQEKEFNDPNYSEEGNLNSFHNELIRLSGKEASIAQFNKLLKKITSSLFIEWLEQECNLSLIITKLLKKNVPYYMPPDFMSDQFGIDNDYYAVLLARIISKPLLNYLNVPENLPDKATFNRAGKLAKELLELVEKHKELVPSTIGGSGPGLFKSVLSQIAIDHLSQAKETKMVLIGEDNPRFKEPAMAFVRPLEALKEIRYKEQRRLKVQLLFEDMGIRYINTFALHKNTKGRPHSEIILDLIPPSCSELDDMPDIRTVQRWLSALDGYGATTSTRSPSLSRPFTRNGKVNTHSSGSVSYVRRFIDKPNLKD